MAKKKKKVVTKAQKKVTWTFFTLFFPSLLLALLAVGVDSKLSLSILLFFYQAVLLKNFIEKYYEGGI